MENLIVCSGCKRTLNQPTVCPMCIRVACGSCLRRGGCKKCATDVQVAAAVAELELIQA